MAIIADIAVRSTKVAQSSAKEQENSILKPKNKEKLQEKMMQEVPKWLGVRLRSKKIAYQSRKKEKINKNKRHKEHKSSPEFG